MFSIDLQLTSLSSLILTSIWPSPPKNYIVLDLESILTQLCPYLFCDLELWDTKTYWFFLLQSKFKNAIFLHTTERAFTIAVCCAGSGAGICSHQQWQQDGFCYPSGNTSWVNTITKVKCQKVCKIKRKKKVCLIR